MKNETQAAQAEAIATRQIAEVLQVTEQEVHNMETTNSATPETEEANSAKSQARAQLESVQEMVQRLTATPYQDAQNAADEAQEIADQLEETNASADEKFNAQHAAKIAADKAADEQHTSDEARQEEAREEIQNDALSVEVRSGWYTPGADKPEAVEYSILLCTGGPAVRIVGELDDYNQAQTAQIEYQDWYTSWTPYDTNSEETAALIEYANCFYYGE